MIYLIPEQDNLFSKENHFSLVIKSNRIIENSSTQSDFISKLIDIKEDDVDIQLDKIDGRISREKDPQLYETCFVLGRLNFL